MMLIFSSVVKAQDRIAPKPLFDDPIYYYAAVNDGKAFIFYITHPGRTKGKPAARNSFDDKRSVVQLAELQYKD